MSNTKAAFHILRQMHRDPRLAYLIGPGSESFELLIEEAAQDQHIDIDVMRRVCSKGLATQPWPSERSIQIRIDEAVENALAKKPEGTTC
ncbi:hypothetical protein SAMN05216344_106102 [Polaromonas sp. OV174]|uniref:hypothetical protein n=1 Tax=Polaromonas sp. OV174 TaxID=1855300 RepID=UPI0008EE82ED|nr:hypothetical protein [Polaromonas sp. OV174]SFB96170.1 hypothetical protein SAMN05216344_106102 [Polaromonas sp. OV174]